MKLCKFTLALALVAATCLPAVAQSRMSLSIPFDFTVDGKTLPAGHYYVHETLGDDNSVWTINGEHNFAMIITNAVESPVKAHALSLVFVRAGDRYCLVQIWNDAHSGHELQLSNMKGLVVAEGNTDRYVEIAAK